MAAPTLNVKLPGPLGDPTLELRSDPRADPRMVASFAPFGLDVEAAALPVNRLSRVEDLLGVAAASEQAFGEVFDALVVGVEFRNSAGVLGPHPFPAGLNDCASAL